MGTENAEWKKGCVTPFLYGMTDIVNDKASSISVGLPYRHRHL